MADHGRPWLAMADHGQTLADHGRPGLTQASQQEDEAGYTEFGDDDSGVYGSGLGYGFAGAPGKRSNRAPLPMQVRRLFRRFL